MKKCLFVALVWFWCVPLLAAAPEFNYVGPTLTREQWLERFRNRDREVNRGRGRRGEREFSMPDIGLYEKFELNIDLRATFSNPFDPEEVDLWAEFTAPSGKVQKIWGFYSPQRFRAVWMMRFSPTSGTTSASVPIEAIFTNAGNHADFPARWHSACTSLSATPTPARFLSG